MKIAVVDDDKNYERIFADALKKNHLQISFVFFDRIQPFLARSSEFDAVFLDIQMPCKEDPSLSDELGLRLAGTLRTQAPQLLIVYMTSHADLMAQAFGVNVIAFIRKDSLCETLTAAIQRIQKELALRGHITVEQYETCRTMRIGVNDILYCQVRNKSVWIITNQGTCQIRRHTLASLYELLQPYGIFYFANRSQFVNIRHVQHIERRSLQIRSIRQPVAVTAVNYPLLLQAFADQRS